MFKTQADFIERFRAGEDLDGLFRSEVMQPANEHLLQNAQKVSREHFEKAHQLATAAHGELQRIVEIDPLALQKAQLGVLEQDLKGKVERVSRLEEATDELDGLLDERTRTVDVFSKRLGALRDHAEYMAAQPPSYSSTARKFFAVGAECSSSYTAPRYPEIIRTIKSPQS